MTNTFCCVVLIQSCLCFDFPKPKGVFLVEIFMANLVMGPGQKFLTWVGLGQFFVAQVRLGQPFMVWV